MKCDEVRKDYAKFVQQNVENVLLVSGKKHVKF